MYPFCKVLLFSNSIDACPFCWFPSLFGVFDGAVFVFLTICIKEYSLGLSNCIYLPLYQ